WPKLYGISAVRLKTLVGDGHSMGLIDATHVAERAHLELLASVLVVKFGGFLNEGHLASEVYVAGDDRCVSGVELEHRRYSGVQLHLDTPKMVEKATHMLARGQRVAW